MTSVRGGGHLPENERGRIKLKMELKKKKKKKKKKRGKDRFSSIVAAFNFSWRLFFRLVPREKVAFASFRKSAVYFISVPLVFISTDRDDRRTRRKSSTLI